jgi:hypothetical protein
MADIRAIFMCGVNAIAYDMRSRTGTVHVPPGHCTDMSGTIRFFTQLDPRVSSISVVSESWPTLIYQRHGHVWTASEVRHG